MGLFFAALNSTLHQLVLAWSGEQSNFSKGVLIMGIGGLIGLYIVLILIQFISHFTPRPNPEK
jgi:hypothetical protein